MKTLTPQQQWIDFHTHRKVASDAIFFIRNAFIPTDPHLPQRLPYAISSGLHPWHVTAHWPSHIARLEQLLANRSISVIGECGLDAMRAGTRKQQRDVFDAHIQLAQKYRLPIVVHQVRMLPEILHHIKKSSGVQFVLHGFNGNGEELKQCLKHPIHFSLGNFVHRANAMQQDVIRMIPDDRLFFETDNAPVSIKTIYAKAAEIRKTSVDVLCTQTLRNFAHLLNEL